MPHITLRHSSNLNDCDFIPFFKELHDLLAEKLDVKLSSCSSMVISHDRYLLGDGHADNAFVHLNIAVKPHIRDVCIGFHQHPGFRTTEKLYEQPPTKNKNFR